MDAYEGTKIPELMWDVLRRGGVIGGSSAGATIQGDYLVRGAPPGPNIMMCEGYEKSMGFLQEEEKMNVRNTSGRRDIDLLSQVQPLDLIKFGFIPEFIGRMPVVAVLEDLSKEALVQILTKPKNAIVRQYQKLFEFENVRLKFSDDALEAIAQLAMERKVGARGLRMILEDLQHHYEELKQRITLVRSYL